MLTASLPLPGPAPASPRVDEQAARGRARRAGRLALTALALWPACVSSYQHEDPPNPIRIGTTLPFSGERAASGVALERAMRLAIDAVNEAGGLGGQLLALEVRDSHSAEDGRGRDATLAMMQENAIPFFIGPEEPEIAYQVANNVKTFKLETLVSLLPGLSSPRIREAGANAAWFRLSPSPIYLACALAKRMIKDGITRANALPDPDDYSGTFATIFGRVFTSMGGTLLPGLQLPASGASFDEVFATIERFSPDASLLITSPSVGAGFLQEWAVRGKVGSFYLGPTLNDPALLRNVPAGVLEGVVGISPDLGQHAEAFRTYFRDATGFSPVPGSHYYFDAVALLALSIADGLAQTRVVPDPGTFKLHLAGVTSPSGPVVSFADLGPGLRLLRDGAKLQYSGAAGDYQLSSDGDSIGNRATLWKISNHTFVDVDHEQCTDAEVLSDYGKP
jgi:neutral amino acid transport system substrate-binding protein